MFSSVGLKPRYILALILLFGLGVRLFLFGGMGGFDSFLYAHSSRVIVGGNFEVANISNPYEFRFLITLPTALSFLILGVNDIAAVLWPLVCSLASIVLVFYLGKLILDDKTALLAAFLFSFFPLEINYATRLFPDVVSAFFMILSVFIFLKAEQIKNNFLRILALFASGLAVGAGFLVKEVSAVLLLFFAVYVTYKRKYEKAFFLPFVAAALFGLCFWIFLYFSTGDFLFQLRIHAHFAREYMAVTPEFVIQKHNLLVYPKGMFGFNLYGLSSFGFFYYFVLFSALMIIIKKLRKAYVLLFWFFTVFLYLEFGAWSLTQHFIPKCFRYLTVLTAPAVLILSFFLNNCLANSKANFRGRNISFSFLRTLIVVFLLATSIYGSYRMRLYNQDEEVKYQLVYDYIKGLPLKPVYCTGVNWPLRLNYYSKYKTGPSYQNPLSGFLLFSQEENRKSLFKNIFRVKEYRELDDTYVIIDESDLFFLGPQGSKVSRFKEIPEFIKRPPGKWELLYTFGKVRLYRVLF